MIVALVWTIASAVAVAINCWGLDSALSDRRWLCAQGGNGRRERRLLVATEHVRDEATMVAVQVAFLIAGVLRLSLGPPRSERADLYRAVTTGLFLLVQGALIWRSVERRRFRRRIIAAKMRMLREGRQALDSSRDRG